MKKISFDTNILLRFFMNDPETEKIEKYLTNHEVEIFISDLVIMEIIFQCEKYYNLDRKQIGTFLDYIIDNKSIKANKKWIDACVDIYLENTNLSFVDIGIYLQSKAKKSLPFYTFDKALQKYDSKNILELK